MGLPGVGLVSTVGLEPPSPSFNPKLRHSCHTVVRNVLDGLVVLCSWLPLLIPSLNNVSSIRAARALRPLRAINRLPGLKRQVETVIASLPHLADVISVRC